MQLSVYDIIKVELNRQIQILLKDIERYHSEEKKIPNWCENLRIVCVCV